MGKVIVTGSNGFIGGELIEYLSQRGFDVVGVTRKNEKESSKVKFLSLDLTDQKDVDRLSDIGSVSAIVHCAGESISSKESNNMQTIERNLAIMSMLLRYAIKNNLDKFIFLSSKKAGNGQEKKMDAYALSKKMCDELLLYCNHRYDKHYVSLRLCNIYGRDRNESRIISHLAKNIIEDRQIITNSPSNTEVELCSVDDVLLVILGELSEGGDCEGIINIDPNFTVTIEELEKHIRNIIMHVDQPSAAARFSAIERKLLPAVKFNIDKFSTV